MSQPDALVEIAREQAGDVGILTGFGRPFGIAADTAGRLYVADMDLHAVARFDRTLDSVQWHTGDPGGWSAPQRVAHGRRAAATRRMPGGFDGPHSVSIGDDGTTWVVTYYRPGVHRLDADGAVADVITTIGDQPLAGPATARLDRTGRLWLTEYAHHSVAVFDAAGCHVGSLGGGSITGLVRQVAHASGQGPGAFDRPHMATELADGTIVVADTWNHRLQRFAESGRWLGWLGDGADGWRDDARPVTPGVAPAAFHGPVAVGCRADGRFIVTDWGNNRLQWFDPKGRLLAIEDGHGLDRPYDAQPLARGLVIADSHNGRVLISGIDA